MCIESQGNDEPLIGVGIVDVYNGHSGPVPLWFIEEAEGKVDEM